MTISTAEQSQDTSIFVAGGSPVTLTVTAVSRAVQAVVTAANTLAVGDVIQLGSIVDMEELVDEIAVVVARTSGSITIDIDTTSFPANGGAGTAEVPSWIEVGNVKDSNGFDGTTSDIDVTHLKSRAMEYRPGLEDFGNLSMSVDIDNANAGHLALRAAKKTRAVLPFKIVLPSLAVRAFQGYVKKFTEAVAVNSVVRGSVDIRITGSVAFGAPVAAVAGPDLRPRFGLGNAAASGSGTVAALFAAMTPYGTNNSIAGTFSLTTTTGNYGWVAVLASLSAAPDGVNFFDGVGFGGWSGAGLVGDNTGASPDPSVSTVTYTDGSGNVWRLFRQDYVHANASAGNYTTS